jgi:hypothetical protein
LLSATDAPRYREAFAKLFAMGELTARPDQMWVLFEGERPASNLRSLLIATALAVFFVVNAWIFWHSLHERLDRRGRDIGGGAL